MARKAILIIDDLSEEDSNLSYLAKNLELNKRFDVFTISSNLPRKKGLKKCEEEINWLINHNYENIYLISYNNSCEFSPHLVKKYEQIKKQVLLIPKDSDEFNDINIPSLIVCGTNNNPESIKNIHNKIDSKINILAKIEKIDQYLLQNKRQDEICTLITDFLRFNLHIKCKKVLNI